MVRFHANPKSKVEIRKSAWLVASLGWAYYRRCPYFKDSFLALKLVLFVLNWCFRAG